MYSKRKPEIFSFVPTTMKGTKFALRFEKVTLDSIPQIFKKGEANA